MFSFFTANAMIFDKKVPGSSNNAKKDPDNKVDSKSPVFRDFPYNRKEIWEEIASSDLLVIGNGRLFVDISLDFMRGSL